MRTFEYCPISATRYITMEDHGHITRVCDCTLHGTYHCRLIGGSPKTKSRGYVVLGKAYTRYQRFRAQLRVPTEYKMAELPLLGSLQITGIAHHPITDIGVDVLFFTLADGKLGFCKICKII